MHSYYTFANQSLMVYSRYGLFLAEVASNFNQALVRDHLFRTKADPDFQIALIEEAMGNFHRYFFVMPTLARFELEIHERVEKGQALTASTLNALMAELFAEGYGGELTMDAERTGITWSQFHTHLYSNFYVYQYATGIAAAHALAEGILAGRPGAGANGLFREPRHALRLTWKPRHGNGARRGGPRSAATASRCRYGYHRDTLRTGRANRTPGERLGPHASGTVVASL